MDAKTAEGAALGILFLCFIFAYIGSKGYEIIQELGDKPAIYYVPSEFVRLVVGIAMIVISFLFFGRGLYLLLPGLF